ncbi:MAG: helix-turn-helix transcriptional regulator [bacterium]
MSISEDRVERKTNGFAGHITVLNDNANGYLFDALGSALDSIVIGVIIVADQGRILHANQAAQRMLDARSPIISLGGFLGALQGESTKELRRAIATALADATVIGAAGIGVPLVDKSMTAATAHVLPLACGDRRELRANTRAAAVFVTPASAPSPADIGTVARIFGLTPAETRLLQYLLSGANLTEAATALGVTEATARTHRNHIFTKTGVSRRTDLLALVGRLVPPIRRPR